MQSYPPDPVTRRGIDLLNEGVEPLITYISPDGEMAFYINGGLAPFPGVTEGASLADGWEGLHPGFNHLDHKGARQAGVTWTDTVYDPAEISFDILLSGRTPEGFRQVMRKWFAAWDPKQQGTLSWVTPEGGEWWCYPRLFRAPPNKTDRTFHRLCKQTFKWSIRNDDAFWRTYDSISQLQFGFASGSDDFDRDDAGTLGPHWSQVYSGTGAGVCETNGNSAIWTRSGTAAREVINRYLGLNETQVVSIYGNPASFTLSFDGHTTSAIPGTASDTDVLVALQSLPNIGTGNITVTGGSGVYTVTFQGALAAINLDSMTGATSGGTNAYLTIATTQDGQPAVTSTDNQLITAQFGTFFEWPLGLDAGVDLWGRMNTTSTNGIRARISFQGVTLSRFIGGVETVLKQKDFIISPVWTDTFQLVLGSGTNSRQYQVMRDGAVFLTFNETDSGSSMGAGFRGAGFGMRGGAGTSHQETPPTVKQWSVGDNASITQTGYLNLTNVGDQIAFPDLVVYGPGTFTFSDGPGNTPTIPFGPLTDGQVALIKTAPGQRSVYDISTDPSEQDLNGFQGFIQSLVSLAFNNNTPPLFSWFESLFGITPQQGVMYSLLGGRWSNGFPGRTLVSAPQTQQMAVTITGGDANSKVVAALTPLRRWPE